MNPRLWETGAHYLEVLAIIGCLCIAVLLAQGSRAGQTPCQPAASAWQCDPNARTALPADPR